MITINAIRIRDGIVTPVIRIRDMVVLGGMVVMLVAGGLAMTVVDDRVAMVVMPEAVARGAGRMTVEAVLVDLAPEDLALVVLAAEVRVSRRHALLITKRGVA